MTANQQLKTTKEDATSPLIQLIGLIQESQAARNEGMKEGIEQGIEQGLEKGLKKGKSSLLKLAEQLLNQEEFRRLKERDDLDELERALLQAISER